MLPPLGIWLSWSLLAEELIDYLPFDSHFTARFVIYTLVFVHWTVYSLSTMPLFFAIFKNSPFPQRFMVIFNEHCKSDESNFS